MAESEAIQSAVTQVAIQTAIATVMLVREVDAGSMSGGGTANLRDASRQKTQPTTLEALDLYL